MRIIIDIDQANAAFDNDRVSRAQTEVARIVAGIATWFDTDGPYDGPLMDVNGNVVGSVSVEGREW